MKQNFEKVFPLLIESEGTKYTNTSGDNGGPTKYGITLNDVRKYVKKGATAEDVKNLTLAQAKDIYKSKYWNGLHCDDLSSGVDYTCFDYGVNSGLGRPRKALQTFSTLSGTKLIDAINNERTSFLKALAAHQEHDQQFLDGWLKRVERVRAKSKSMATQNNVAGPIIATTTVVAGSGFASWMHWLHNHEVLLMGGAAIVAVALGFLIHHIVNKGK